MLLKPFASETGYDSWADAYAAAQNGDTITVGANTAEAVAAAKADFAVVSIAINADGTVDVGLPAAPVDGFNGTVSILGCETALGFGCAPLPPFPANREFSALERRRIRFFTNRRGIMVKYSLIVSYQKKKGINED